MRPSLNWLLITVCFSSPLSQTQTPLGLNCMCRMVQSKARDYLKISIPVRERTVTHKSSLLLAINYSFLQKMKLVRSPGSVMEHLMELFALQMFTPDLKVRDQIFLQAQIPKKSFSELRVLGLA